MSCCRRRGVGNHRAIYGRGPQVLRKCVHTPPVNRRNRARLRFFFLLLSLHSS
jgi:hypothetical protein